MTMDVGYLIFRQYQKMIKLCNLIKLIYHYFLCKLTLSQAVTNAVTILAHSRQNQHKPSDEADRVRFQIKAFLLDFYRIRVRKLTGMQK